MGSMFLITSIHSNGSEEGMLGAFSCQGESM